MFHKNLADKKRINANARFFDSNISKVCSEALMVCAKIAGNAKEVWLMQMGSA